jgi:hypothetical protein
VIGVFGPAAIIRKISPKENAMKHHRVILAIAVLVLVTLACQTVMGGGARDVDDEPVATTEGITRPQG